MPKSKDIAKYIRENNIDAKSIIFMLEKYKAIAMLPAILKSLKHLELQFNPAPVIELSNKTNTGSEILKSIENKFLSEKSNEDKKDKISKGKKVVENKALLGGFRVIKDYKLYDYSISGYLDRLLS